MPTASIYLNKYVKPSKGKFPVSIKVYENKERVYYPTKYRLSAEEYAKLFTEKPGKGLKDIKADLDLLVTKAEVIFKDLQDGFTWELFNKRYSRKVGDRDDVFILLKEREEALKEAGQISTSVTYKNTLSSLRKYHKKDKLYFRDISASFLKGYKKWMQEKENPCTTTTIGIYLRTVRYLFNEAIDEGVITKQMYPFHAFVIPSGRNIKKALSFSDISLIYNYHPASESMEKARDFWIFSYLGSGMNIKDIALLKYSNINGDHITFERAKTASANSHEPKKISFFLNPEVERIIQRWGNNDKKPETFIFPILKAKLSPDEQYKIIHLFTAFVNKYMKRVASDLMIASNITSYVARHSASTVMKNSGISVEAISEMLGHLNIKTTQNYLGSLESDAKRKISATLTDFNKLKAI